MSHQQEFVDLDKSIHDRDSFDCQEPELNTFIRTLASKHMKSGISKTQVLPATISLPSNLFPICSFFTIAGSTIKREDLPYSEGKKLPVYPVPVFLIAQLAVHDTYQGQGLGQITLIQALKYLLNVNEFMPSYAVIVDCLNSDAEKFYLKFGFVELCKHKGKTRLYLPMKAVIKLFGES